DVGALTRVQAVVCWATAQGVVAGRATGTVAEDHVAVAPAHQVIGTIEALEVHLRLERPGTGSGASAGPQPVRGDRAVNEDPVDAVERHVGVDAVELRRVEVHELLLAVVAEADCLRRRVAGVDAELVMAGPEVDLELDLVG